MADFAAQAQAVAMQANTLPDGKAGMVTVLLGNNDVCAQSMEQMTDPQVFETQFRAGLDVLAGNDSTRSSQVNVLGIPAIYWLWTAKFDQPWCTIFAWSFVPCDNLLDNPADDCESGSSRNDPDADYPGDGTNCKRRKLFHRIIRDEYNTLLQSVSNEYRENGLLPNIRYTDVYDVPFTSIHVNGGGGLFSGGGDCFHPSREGHALLADEAWCRSHWGINDNQCPN
jgi:lysophospholipase L1-like esterase